MCCIKRTLLSSTQIESLSVVHAEIYQLAEVSGSQSGPNGPPS